MGGPQPHKQPLDCRQDAGAAATHALPAEEADWFGKNNQKITFSMNPARSGALAGTVCTAEGARRAPATAKTYLEAAAPGFSL